MQSVNILNQIGNTPLLKLKQASEITGCNRSSLFTNKRTSLSDKKGVFISMFSEIIKNVFVH